MADKVTLHATDDEWYPVWSVSREETYAADVLAVDAAQAERWERVFREFDVVQDEISAAVKVARSAEVSRG